MKLFRQKSVDHRAGHEKTKTDFREVGVSIRSPLAKPLPKSAMQHLQQLMNFLFIGIIPATSEKKQHKFPAFACKSERVIRKSWQKFTGKLKSQQKSTGKRSKSQQDFWKGNKRKHRF